MLPGQLLPDFVVNFVANLGGAMFGVLLAFWLDRRRARRESKGLYGRVLHACRFELGYQRSYANHEMQRLKGGAPFTSSLAGWACPLLGVPS
jgi:hypothetical protein